jgi:hypothetical protein
MPVQRFAPMTKNTAGNRAACMAAQTSPVSPGYCRLTMQHQFARIPSLSRGARRARCLEQVKNVSGGRLDLGLA